MLQPGAEIEKELNSKPKPILFAHSGHQSFLSLHHDDAYDDEENYDDLENSDDLDSEEEKYVSKSKRTLKLLQSMESSETNPDEYDDELNDLPSSPENLLGTGARRVSISKDEWKKTILASLEQNTTTSSPTSTTTSSPTSTTSTTSTTNGDDHLSRLRKSPNKKYTQKKSAEDHLASLVVLNRSDIPPSVKQWPCSHCTLFNHNNHLSCVACSTERKPDQETIAETHKSTATDMHSAINSMGRLEDYDSEIATTNM